MSEKDLNKYEVGQRVWFIREYPEPEVKSAKVTGVRIFTNEKNTTADLEFLDDEGVYRSTTCHAFVYSTRAAASEHLNEVRERVWQQRLNNCEVKIYDLKMKIKKYQDELQNLEQEKKAYSRKLEKLK